MVDAATPIAVTPTTILSRLDHRRLESLIAGEYLVIMMVALNRRAGLIIHDSLTNYSAYSTLIDRVREVLQMVFLEDELRRVDICSYHVLR